MLPPLVWSWTGFYIGGHGGWGSKDDPFSSSSSDGGVSVTGFRSDGWVAGGQVGYNWQVGAFFGGLELDVSAAGITGNSAAAVNVSISPGSTNTASNTVGDDVKMLGTARGRFGWTPGPDWLLYGTGGLAWEQIDQTATNQGTSTGTVSFTTASFSTSPANFFGWVAGAGVEVRLFGSNWIGRLEYLHYDFGHTRFSFSSSSSGFGTTPLVSFGTTTAGDQTIDVVRGGLSYKF
jgi:outer membrane immunogenic protein